MAMELPLSTRHAEGGGERHHGALAAPGAAGASSFASSRASRASKAWAGSMYQEELLHSEARGAIVDAEEAIGIVRRVTRFATTMCVVIAVLKISVYWVTKSPVVKTSALDSCGDLVANFISMYTTTRMSRTDPKEFPTGQSKFEPVGVLIFSVLMASAMMSNAVSNIGELSSGEELSRQEALEGFWDFLFGATEDGSDGSDAWKALQPVARKASLTGMLAQVFSVASYEDARAAAMPTMNLVAGEQTEAQKKFKTFFAIFFLWCCACYKFSLWVYCVTIAIPKSGSTVLVALANDKRNDMISSSFVISCKLLQYIFGENIGDLADKLDPLSSCFLSVVIAYLWCCLAKDQVTSLSQGVADPQALAAVRGVLDGILPGADGEAFVSDLTMYRYNECKYMVEIELSISDLATPWSRIEPLVEKITDKVGAVRVVERVLVSFQGRR